MTKKSDTQKNKLEEALNIIGNLSEERIKESITAHNIAFKKKQAEAKAFFESKEFFIICNKISTYLKNDNVLSDMAYEDHRVYNFAKQEMEELEACNLVNKEAYLRFFDCIETVLSDEFVNKSDEDFSTRYLDYRGLEFSVVNGQGTVREIKKATPKRLCIAYMEENMSLLLSSLNTYDVEKALRDHDFLHGIHKMYKKTISAKAYEEILRLKREISKIQSLHVVLKIEILVKQEDGRIIDVKLTPEANTLTKSNLSNYQKHEIELLC